MTTDKTENALISVNAFVDTLAFIREKDVERGFMNENFEPFNGHLSAEENKKCWQYLSKHFLINTLKTIVKTANSSGECMTLSMDSIFELWLTFLQVTNDAVKSDKKDEDIFNIINRSGVARETWIKFLD